jgi:hypothetical protein
VYSHPVPEIQPGAISSGSGQTSHPLWRSPCERDHHPNSIENRTRNVPTIMLAHQANAHQANWPTPNEEEKTAFLEKRTKRLNPRFVEWLMGFPIGWTEV